MGLIATLITFAAGTLIKSSDANSNNTNIRDAFNNTAVLTDVARTISVAHTFAADILFTDALYDIGDPGANRPRDGHFSRNVVVGGTLRALGEFYAADGTTTAPSMRFWSHSVGFSAPVSETLVIITNSLERARVTSGGIVLIGTTVTTGLVAGDLGLAGTLKIGTALVALGGGAAPTLGTIGGTGPATAAQNTWLKLIDSAGAAFWVPAWK